MAKDKDDFGDLLKIRKYQYASTWPVVLALVFLAALHYHLWSREHHSAVICAFFAFIALKTQIVYKHSLVCPKCGNHFYGPYRLFLPYSRVCKSCGLDFSRDFQVERRLPPTAQP